MFKLYKVEIPIAKPLIQSDTSQSIYFISSWTQHYQLNHKPLVPDFSIDKQSTFQTCLLTFVSRDFEKQISKNQTPKFHFLSH